jgi:hypothetical protein
MGAVPARVTFCGGTRSFAIDSLRVSYRRPYRRTEGAAMSLHLYLAPLVALIAGILILIVPRLLNYVVAIYLIIIGLIGLAPMIHV